METFLRNHENEPRLTFRVMSLPGKVLATCIILTLSSGMFGALGQIVVHDIIPTFFSKSSSSDMSHLAEGHGDNAGMNQEMKTTSKRGDLFAEMAPEKLRNESKPIYKDEQFVWTLKWTHIHLFGMGMIFIFMGVISVLLDIDAKHRAWLIVLPFIGGWIDILAMWLKAFVSPVFFWLHISCGGVFALVFTYVSLRAMSEMWIRPVKAP